MTGKIAQGQSDLAELVRQAKATIDEAMSRHDRVALAFSGGKDSLTEFDMSAIKEFTDLHLSWLSDLSEFLNNPVSITDIPPAKGLESIPSTDTAVNR